MRILVTGGAGFIGSNLVRTLVHAGHQVLNFDKLSYAGNRHSLVDLETNSSHSFALLETGTKDSLLDACNFIAAVEKR